MKKYLLATCATLTLMSATSYAKDLNDEYPMTKEEREAKEMGSVLGNDGIVLRPASSDGTTFTTFEDKDNQDAILAEGKINKFLWKASREILDVAPLIIVDAKNGILSTDWYSLKGAPNTSRKITVKIIGASLSASSLEVKSHQRSMKNGTWAEEDEKSKAAHDTAAKILKRAKEISGNR